MTSISNAYYKIRTYLYWSHHEIADNRHKQLAGSHGVLREPMFNAGRVPPDGYDDFFQNTTKIPSAVFLRGL